MTQITETEREVLLKLNRYKTTQGGPFTMHERQFLLEALSDRDLVAAGSYDFTMTDSGKRLAYAISQELKR